MVLGFSRIFNKIQDELFKTNLFDVSLSGSTLLSIMISYPKLICANVGDSRAVLVRKRRYVLNQWISSTGKWYTFQRTISLLCPRRGRESSRREARYTRIRINKASVWARKEFGWPIKVSDLWWRCTRTGHESINRRQPLQSNRSDSLTISHWARNLTWG